MRTFSLCNLRSISLELNAFPPRTARPRRVIASLVKAAPTRAAAAAASTMVMKSLREALVTKTFVGQMIINIGVSLLMNFGLPVLTYSK